MAYSTFFYKNKPLPPKPFACTPIREKQTIQSLEYRNSKLSSQQLPLKNVQSIDDPYFCHSCLKKNAIKRCPNCQNKWFCNDCFSRIHSTGKFQFHCPISPLQNNDQDSSDQQLTPIPVRKRLKYEQIQDAMVAETPIKAQKKQLDFLSEIRLKMLSDDLRQNYQQVSKQLENQFTRIASDIKSRLSIIRIQLNQKLNRQLENLSANFKKKNSGTVSSQKPNKSEKHIHLFSPAKDSESIHIKQVRKSYYHANKHKSQYNKESVNQTNQSTNFDQGKQFLASIKPNQEFISEFDRLIEKIETKKVILREKKDHDSRSVFKSKNGKSMVLRQNSKTNVTSQKNISIISNQSNNDLKSKGLHWNILQTSSHQSSIIEGRNSKSKGKNNLNVKNNKRCSFNLNQQNVYYMPQQPKILRNPSQKFIFLNENQKRIKKCRGRMFN